jgi:hypothetical protein
MTTDYIVSYTNGSSGNFLKSLIERNLLKTDTYTPITPGQYNDAHLNDVDPRNFGFRKPIPSSDNRNYSVADEFQTAYKFAKDIPAFIDTHVYWPDMQLGLFPDVRLAVILHREEDITDIGISGFYKTEMSVKWQKEYANKYPLHFPTSNVVFEKVRQLPKQLWGPKELRVAIEIRKCMIIGTGFHLIEPIDDPRIYYIQYRDLVTNVDAVTTFVEQITGQPTSPNVIKDIKDYQTRQEEFMKKAKAELGL